MLDGAIDFQNAHDFERMHTAEVLERKKRVRLVGDAELTKKHPAIRSAIVEVTTLDGRQFRTVVDRLPGAPYNPLSAEEIEAKFLSLSVPVLGESRSRVVIDQGRALEGLQDVAALGAMLRV